MELGETGYRRRLCLRKFLDHIILMHKMLKEASIVYFQGPVIHTRTNFISESRKKAIFLPLKL